MTDNQVWANVLLFSYYLLTLGLGGVLFVALHYVAAAGWNVAFRRVPEAMAFVIPVAALGLVVVLLGHPSLYPWMHSTGETEAVMPLRHLWFERPFFLVRSVIYLAVWIVLGLGIVTISRRQDKSGDLSYTRSNVALSAVFVLVFGYTFWLASQDWIMSLEPKMWSSTIFAVYQFAGLFVSALAAIILLSTALRRFGPFRQAFTGDHMHDMGKLLFGFSTFWMYIWFCQYMLIWYVNNSEETGYYTLRLQGGWNGTWGRLTIVSLILNWAIPFFVLLPNGMKRCAGVLAAMSFLVLVGHWLDLYICIMPYFGEPTLMTAVWEGVLFAVALGVFGLVTFLALKRAALIPERDPYLVESLAPLSGHKRNSVTPSTRASH